MKHAYEEQDERRNSAMDVIRTVTESHRCPSCQSKNLECRVDIKMHPVFQGNDASTCDRFKCLDCGQEWENAWILTHAMMVIAKTGVCKHCGQNIHEDSRDYWIAETGGDDCPADRGYGNHRIPYAITHVPV